MTKLEQYKQALAQTEQQLNQLFQQQQQLIGAVHALAEAEGNAEEEPEESDPEGNASGITTEQEDNE